MADIFTSTDFKTLLNGRRIMFIGDSNVRAMYKDFVWLNQNNTIIPDHCLKAKLEKSFAGDYLAGDSSSSLHKGRDFKEIREYQDESIYLHFTFTTKCYTDGLIYMFEQIKAGTTLAPDIIIFNSCLWDISRWGPNGVPNYREGMVKLMRLMHDCLPCKTLVVFTTTLPLSLSMRGGFLVAQVNFLSAILPYEVMEGNLFIRDLVVDHGFDVVDLHFHMRHQIHRRRQDGVHWEPIAVRHITNILLTHISQSLEISLPGRARPHALKRISNVEMAPWTEYTDSSKNSLWPRSRSSRTSSSNSSSSNQTPQVSSKLLLDDSKGRRHQVVSGARVPAAPVIDRAEPRCKVSEQTVNLSCCQSGGNGSSPSGRSNIYIFPNYQEENYHCKNQNGVDHGAHRRIQAYQGISHQSQMYPYIQQQQPVIQDYQIPYQNQSFFLGNQFTQPPLLDYVVGQQLPQNYFQQPWASTPLHLCQKNYPNYSQRYQGPYHRQ